MPKIYMNKVHEDNGWTFSFGTKDDLVAWEQQKKDWESQDLCCESDIVLELGKAKDISEAVQLINQAIQKERR